MIISLISSDCIDLFFICVSHDAIFTTFATIFIFFVGYLLNRYYEYRKEVKRLNELEKYFYSLFEQIKSPVNDQIQILNEMADDIADKKKKQFKFKDNVNLDVTNLLKIAHSDLHKIFVVRKKGGIEPNAEHFTNMINTLNYIVSLKKNLVLNYENYYNRFSQYSNNFKDAVNLTLRQYDNSRSILKRNNTALSTDDFLLDLDRVIYYWRQCEDSTNIYLTHENYIQRLKELCKNYEGDERANTILPYVATAQSAFDSIDFIKNTYKEQFQKDAKILKSNFESFESAIKYFRGENGKSKVKKNHYKSLTRKAATICCRFISL